MNVVITDDSDQQSFANLEQVVYGPRVYFRQTFQGHSDQKSRFFQKYFEKN